MSGVLVQPWRTWTGWVDRGRGIMSIICLAGLPMPHGHNFGPLQHQSNHQNNKLNCSAVGPAYTQMATYQPVNKVNMCACIYHSWSKPWIFQAGGQFDGRMEGSKILILGLLIAVQKVCRGFWISGWINFWKLNDRKGKKHEWWLQEKKCLWKPIYLHSFFHIWNLFEFFVGEMVRIWFFCCKIGLLLCKEQLDNKKIW